MNKKGIKKKPRLPLMSEMIRHLSTIELEQAIGGASGDEDPQAGDQLHPNIPIVKEGCTGRPN